MKILYFFFLFTILNLVVCEDEEFKIGYGKEASLVDFPYAVNIKSFFKITGMFQRDMCTGAYVNTKWILAPGRCIREDIKADWIQVCMGQESAYSCEEFRSNREVDQIKFSQDKLLVMLHVGQGFHDFAEPKRIGVGKLPFPRSAMKDYSQQKCTALGWGQTGPNKTTPVLLKITVDIVANTCNGPQFLCAVDDSKSVCLDEVWGPLIYGGVILGMFQSGSDEIDCARSQVQFIRVARYLDYIYGVIEGKYSSKATNKSYSMFYLFITVIINLIK